MIRIAPKLQAVLDELAAISAAPIMTSIAEDGALPFQVRHFFSGRSRCHDVALSTIAARLRALAALGLVERVPNTRPVRWRLTDAGREQVTPA